MLIVESRGTGGMLVRAGELGGFDLRRHENLMFCPPVARPAEIYALARVVIAPSVWEEPAGRVAAEAVANGIPAVVSDRGGLGEMCGAGGFVLPLPDDLTLATRTPVSAEAVAPWIDLLVRLCDDQAFYDAACARAADAGKMYDHEMVARDYVRFFENVLARRSASGREPTGK
jgi:glycosyltransferase involved in cell wall biosynthesis